MKTSTETASLARITGEEKAIELIAKAGFDAWDFTLSSMCKYDWQTMTVSYAEHPLGGRDYLAFVRRLKNIGLDNGIVCNQSHAPAPSYFPGIITYFKRAIECTAEAGGKICVIHPDNNKGAEENAEMFLELLPFAKEHGVKIATENMWNWDEEKGHASVAACTTPESFCRHIDVINDDWFVACLDIGHAEMKGSETSAVELVKALGKRLQALHIHDNDKLNDSHQVPFSMDIDFTAVVKTLKEIGYNGYFTLEAYKFLSAYSQENVFNGVKKMAEAARKLADMYEK